MQGEAAIKVEDVQSILDSEAWKSRGTAGNKYAEVTASVNDDAMRALGGAMHEHRVVVKKWNEQYGHIIRKEDASSSSAAAAPQAPKFPPASVKKILEEGKLHLEAAKKADKDLTPAECKRVSSNSMPIARRSAETCCSLFADFSLFGCFLPFW